MALAAGCRVASIGVLTTTIIDKDFSAMSSKDTMRTALFGNPPSADFKPSRAGVLDAHSQLQDQVTAQATAGIASYATVALLPTAPVPANGTNARVYDDPVATNNTFWIVVAGAWQIDSDFIGILEQLIQPAVDAAAGAALSADAALDAAGELPVLIGRNAKTTTTVFGSTTPNTTEQTYYKPCSVPFTKSGYITSVSLRVASGGTCNLYSVNALTGEILRKWSTVTVVTGLNEIPGATFAGYIAPAGSMIMYEPVTAGGVMYAASSSGALTDNGGAGYTVGNTMTVRWAPTQTFSISVTISSDALAVHQRIVSVEISELDEVELFSNRKRSDIRTKTIGLATLITPGAADSSHNTVFVGPLVELPTLIKSVTMQFQGAAGGFLVTFVHNDDDECKISAIDWLEFTGGLQTIELARPFVAPGKSRFGWLPVVGNAPDNAGYVGETGSGATISVAAVKAAGIGGTVTITLNNQIPCIAVTGDQVEFAGGIAATQESVEVVAAHSGYNLAKFFEWGPFMIRDSAIPTWAARAWVTTLFHYAPDGAETGRGGDWLTAWKSSRLRAYVNPGFRMADLTYWTSAAADTELLDTVVQANFAGFAAAEEPDYNGHPLQGSVGFDAGKTPRFFDRDYARYRRYSLESPIEQNLMGAFLGQLDTARLWQVDQSSVNVYSFDSYPSVNGIATMNQRLFNVDMTKTGKGVATVGPMGVAAGNLIQHDHAYGGLRFTKSRGKPCHAYIATSAIVDNAPVPTPQETRFYIWDAIINGVCGIRLFTYFIGTPYSYDASDNQLLTEIAAAAANVATIEALDSVNGVIVDKIKGNRRPYRIRYCPGCPGVEFNYAGAVYNPPVNDQLQAPFQGCEIPMNNGDTVRIVQNMRETANSLTDVAWSMTNVAFLPYETKAFLASAPTVNLLTNTNLVAFDFSSAVLPPHVTFSRNSQGWCWNSAGNLVSSANNVARFGYDADTLKLLGIMIEPTATNICKQSSSFNTAPWGNGNGAVVTPDTNLSIDGATVADNIADNSGAAANYIVQYINAASEKTWQFYIAKDAISRTTRFVAIRLTNDFIYLDTSTGVYSIVGTTLTNVSVVSRGNFWRIAATDPNSTQPQIYPAYGSWNGSSWVVSGAITGSCVLAFAQCESGSVKTSPIPTTTANVTRQADSLVLNWGAHGVANGTIMVRYTFGDGTTQDVSTVVAGGVSTVPTNLNSTYIRRIERV